MNIRRGPEAGMVLFKAMAEITPPHIAAQCRPPSKANKNTLR
jgi:hypothetical protein